MFRFKETTVIDNSDLEVLRKCKLPDYPKPEIKLKPPLGGSDVIKPCEHKFIYLGQKTIGGDNSLSKSQEVDVFYCEKCLEYKYKDR